MLRIITTTTIFFFFNAEPLRLSWLVPCHLELEEQWELEEAAERRKEEARMDNWSFRDKDDY